MAVETTLTKRPALYKGEIGFFADNVMAEEDIRLFALHSETMHRITSERNLQALKFLWALVHKATENTDFWLDKDVAMADLKKRAHFTKMLWDSKTRMMIATPRTLKRIGDEQLRLLTDRIADVICAEIMPGMKKNDLYREIEEMIGVRSPR